jgi:hypothetical protein
MYPPTTFGTKFVIHPAAALLFLHLTAPPSFRSVLEHRQSTSAALYILDISKTPKISCKTYTILLEWLGLPQLSSIGWNLETEEKESPYDRTAVNTASGAYMIEIHQRGPIIILPNREYRVEAAEESDISCRQRGEGPLGCHPPGER